MRLCAASDSSQESTCLFSLLSPSGGGALSTLSNSMPPCTSPQASGRGFAKSWQASAWLCGKSKQSLGDGAEICPKLFHKKTSLHALGQIKTATKTFSAMLCHTSSVQRSPSSVALVEPVMRTLTKSPGRAVPRANTTTLFCSVRPKSCSRDRLLTPSTSTS